MSYTMINHKNQLWDRVVVRSGDAFNLVDGQEPFLTVWRVVHDSCQEHLWWLVQIITIEDDS